jgi:hypothetical protein
LLIDHGGLPPVDEADELAHTPFGALRERGWVRG